MLLVEADHHQIMIDHRIIMTVIWANEKTGTENLAEVKAGTMVKDVEITEITEDQEIVKEASLLETNTAGLKIPGLAAFKVAHQVH